MIAGHPQVCLYMPEIPQNTGNIGRLCAATQTRLHLIEPFGFNADDKNLRRPGLDYWPYLDLEIHKDFSNLGKRFSPDKMAFFSKKGVRPYTQMPEDTNLLIFGQETKGLPDTLWEEYPESFYQIPMYHPKVRSLNLSNSVAIIVYAQLARQNFKSL